MRRLIRRSGLTWLGVATLLLWLLVAAAIPFLAGVLTAKGQTLEDDTPRYTPSARGGRPAVLDRADVLDLASAVWGPELADRVLALARCESSLRPDADANWPYIGLLQIHPSLHRRLVERVVGYPVTLEEARLLLRDPVVNLWVGYLLYLDAGFAPWPWCGR